MREQVGDGLAVVSAADGLREDGRDVDGCDLGALGELVIVGARVGDLFCGRWKKKGD